MERRKKIAMEKVLQSVSDKELEVDINDIYPSDKGLAVVSPLTQDSIPVCNKMSKMGSCAGCLFDIVKLYY